MRTVIYPGTFDPVTFGHIDIIQRARSLFDRVIVGVGKSLQKEVLFTTPERVAMIEEAVRDFDAVTVTAFDGLLVRFAESHGALAVIRGLRAVSDFEYELQMALMNRKLSSAVETVFLMPNQKYSYLNSSIVREVSRFGGDVSHFVPSHVKEQLIRKQSERNADIAGVSLDGREM